MNLNLTLIAQAITFTVFIWVTVKFIWPHMLRAIEARQKTIADGLAAAEEGKRSLEVSNQRADEEIKKARDRAAALLTQAEKRSAQMIEEARNSAKEEGNREKAAAKAEIEQQVTRAREQLRDQVASLAIAGAEKILRREVDAKAHGELLESIKKQL
jgi:F-type H+-transporting ATPase subunit b